MIKDRLTLTLFLLLLFPLLNSPKVGAEEKIQIGVSLPLTGAAAHWGNDLKNILLFANQQLFQNKYSFDFQDDRCHPQAAVTVAKLFTNIKKYKYVTGFVCSGTILATAAEYEKAGTLAIVLGGSAPEISDSGDYIFRTWPNDLSAASLLFNYIARQHKKLGILTEETDYARALEKALINHNSDNKLSLHSESFLSAENDFRTMLLKLQNSGIDSLFLNTQTEQSLFTVVKKLRELKINLPLYSVYMADARAFLDQAGEMAEGITVVDVPSAMEVLDIQGQKLYQEYVKLYGEPKTINLLFISTMNALQALDQAIKSKTDLRQYLYQNKFHGITGQWNFDKNGDIQGLEFKLNRISNNKPVTLLNDQTETPPGK